MALRPGESRNDDPRYLDIHEDDPLDEAPVTNRGKRASELPGWVGGLPRQGKSPSCPSEAGAGRVNAGSGRPGIQNAR